MILTTPILFIDANIPIYAGGPPHRLREPAGRVLDLIAAYPESFITNAEVLQEVLHRSLRHRAGAQRLFSSFATLMTGRVEAVYGADVEQAAVIAARYPGVEARDGVHAAVMSRLGIKYVVSADRRLSRVDELERLDPQDVAAWATRLLNA